MNRLLRGAALALALSIAACATPPTYRQATVPSAGAPADGKAAVLIAVDFRETTSLRDGIPHMGRMYFRRIDGGYGERPNGDYDFGIEYSISADWAAVFGSPDRNREPRLFEIDEGVYVVERIEMGDGGLITPLKGYDPIAKRARYGTFTVRRGEVVDLGKVVVDMMWRRGLFGTSVEDNGTAAYDLVASRGLSGVQSRPITMAPMFPFKNLSGW